MSTATGSFNALSRTATPICGRISRDEEDGLPVAPSAAHGRERLLPDLRLVPLLAERGLRLSREQVFRLVTQPPQRPSMDTLTALCDILACQPNDLIEVQVVNEQVRKTAGGTKRPAPQARRTTIRRPEGL